MCPIESDLNYGQHNNFIAKCIAETSDENGVSNLARLGSHINKNQPDFDSRNYGYAKFSKFIQSIGRFKVVQEKNGQMSVRDLQAK